MAELHIPRAHSNNWYDNLAQAQSGYYYPWTSEIGDHNGEDSYVSMIHDHIQPQFRVLDIGCGHGDLALDLADKCSHIVAYDRVAKYIDLAKENQASRNISNVEFLCYDATDNRDDETRLPVEDNSVDMIICRRGPLHWLEDSVRACRDGAVLLCLSPMEEPIPAWTSKVPHIVHYENSGRHTGTGSIHQSVENRLHQAGLQLHSGWSFDVPEVFAEPKELYKVLTWGIPASDVPSFEDLEHRLQLIYETYAEPRGIVLRHCRFLWKAIVNKAK